MYHSIIYLSIYIYTIRQQPLATEIWTEYLKYGGKIDDTLKSLFIENPDNIKFIKDYIEATYKIYNAQLNGNLKRYIYIFVFN